jgi:hypothetical protein
MLLRRYRICEPVVDELVIVIETTYSIGVSALCGL